MTIVTNMLPGVNMSDWLNDGICARLPGYVVILCHANIRPTFHFKLEIIFYGARIGMDFLIINDAGHNCIHFNNQRTALVIAGCERVV